MSSLWLTVIFSGKKVVACLVATTDSNQTELQTHSELHLFTDIEHAPVAVDKALQELGPDSETVSKVIYSLPADWISEGDIADGYKPLLKKITTDLGLEPMGFVSTSESIVSHLTAHQSRLSTILLTLSSEQMTVTWIVSGSIFHEVSVGRSNSIAADFVEALARILTKPDSTDANAQHQAHIPHFPTSLHLGSLELDHSQLHASQQELLAVNWADVKNFVHEPVISVLDADQVMTAIARQTAQAVARTDQGEELPVAVVAQTEETETGVEFGDDAQSSEAGLEAESDFGQEFAPWSAAAAETGSSVHENVMPAELHPETSEGSVTQSHHQPRPKPMFGVKDGNSKWQRWLYQLSHHHFMVLGVVVGIVVLLLSGVVYTATATTVAITVRPTSKVVNKDVQITVDGSITQSNPEKLILAATKISKKVEGKKSGSSTGISLIGEEATGKIEISNKTTAEKVFDAGTVVTNGAIKLNLNEKVTVPAAQVESSSDGEKKTYGKVTALVTAAAIGAESNLAKGTALTIASFDKSSFEAEVSEALTGGASREVRVVSKKDQQQVATDLQKDLEKIAQQEFADEQSSGTYIIPTGVSTVASTEYSAEIDDEVNSFELTMTLAVEAYEYQAADLRPLAEAVLADLVPPGYALTSDQPQILSQPSTQTKAAKTTVVLDANISGKVSPLLQSQELQAMALGKSVSDVQSELKSKEGVKEVTITIEPALLTRFVTKLPTSPDRVKVSVTP